MAKQKYFKNPYAEFSKQQQLKDAALEQEAIDKGLIYDKKVLNKLGWGVEGAGNALLDAYPDLKGDAFDAHESYIDEGTLKGGQFDFKQLDKMRAENQSNWEQAGNAAYRIGVNLIPQIAASAASMVDIPGYFDAEAAASNEIIKWADSIQKESEVDAPIYEEQQGMNLSDPAWWFSRGSSLVTSMAAFAVTGMGAGALVKGIGALSKGKALAQMLLGAETGAKASRATSVLASAAMMNQAEAAMEASQVYQQIYDQKRAEGLTSVLAKEAAASAAATTMNLNRLNIILNLTSASAFLKPFSGARQLLSAPSIGRELLDIGKEMGQEAAEELTNHVASQAGIAKGNNKEYGLKDALKDMGSAEGFEAAFLGALGGGGQTMLSNMTQRSTLTPSASVDENGNKVSAKTAYKNRYEAQQANIEDIKRTGVKFSEPLQSAKENILFQTELSEAIANNDKAKVDELLPKMFEHQVLQAAKTGTLSVLEDMYKKEAAKNPEEVGQEYVDKAKKAVTDLKSLEKVYNNYADYANVDEIYKAEANRIRVENINNDLKKDAVQVKSALDEEIAQIASKYKFTEERETLIKKEGKVVETITKPYERPLPYSSKNIEENPGASPDNIAEYNKFLEEVKSLPNYELNERLQRNIDTQDTIISKLAAEKQLLVSPEYQKKYAEQKAKEEEYKSVVSSLPKVDSLSQLERLKTIYDGKDSKLTEAIEKRIEQVKLAKQAEEAGRQHQAEFNSINSTIDKLTAETVDTDLDTLQETIDNAAIPNSLKETLTANLVRKAESIKNGETNSVDPNNPLAAFQQGENPDEEGTTTPPVNTANNTLIPQGIPNKKTEKEDVEAEVEQGVQELSQTDTAKVTGTDADGNLIYEYNRTQEGHNRAAYLSREYNQVVEDGKVNREELTDLLDNLELLNPEKFLPRTKFKFVPKDDADLLVYNPESTTKEKITWGQREQQLIDRYGKENYKQSEEYLGEVPIVAVLDNGEEIFYLHSADWIKEENVSGDLATDKNSLLNIRNEVLTKGEYSTEITYKSFGTLFRTADGKSIPVSEAMPDENLIFAVAKNNKLETSAPIETLLKGGKNATILNKTFDSGRLYSVVQVGPTQYMAIPLERTEMTEPIADSIIKVIALYLENDPNNQLVKDVNKALNLDILTLDGVNAYLKQFIYLTPTQGNLGLSPILNIVTDPKNKNFNSSLALISVTKTGIEFGRPRTNNNLGGTSTNKDKKVVTISRNFQEVGTAANKSRAKAENINKLSVLRSHLNSMLLNSDLQALENKTPAVTITDDNKVISVPYSDYLKSSFKTNILSVNVGTDTKPVWAYTIQPTILFNTDTVKARVTPKAPMPVNKAVVTPVVDTALEEDAKVLAAEADISTEQLVALLDNAESGIDVGVSVAVLAKAIEIRNTVVPNNIEDKIANLKQKKIELEKEYDSIVLIYEDTEEETRKKSARTTALTLQISDLNDEITALESSATTKPIATTGTVTAGNLTVDLADGDLADDEDFIVPTMSEEQEKSLDIINKYLIKGLSPGTQQALISYIAANIISLSAESKIKYGDAKISSKPVLDTVKNNFIALQNKLAEAGLVNKAAKIQEVVDQFGKVSELTNQYLNLLATGKVSELTADVEEDADNVGLEKTFSDDWSFTVNSKSTASADLKKFFSFIEKRDANGPVVNPLGFTEVVPFDEVYNTLHEILANKPADWTTMKLILLDNVDKFPWLSSVVEKLDKSSEKIKNEFVSDMAKHHVDMRLIMWSKDRNGQYTLQDFSSNSSSIENRLIINWNNNLKGVGTQSNLINLNAEGEAIFDAAVASNLINQAKEWATNPPSIATEESKKASFNALASWLGNFGIVLTDATYQDLAEGKFKNKAPLKWVELFTNSKGLVNVLGGELAKYSGAAVENSELLTDTVVKQLAKLDAFNNTNVFSNSFQTGGKTVYSYSNNNYMVNRMRDLTAVDKDGNFINKELIDGLKEISFTQDSTWLNDLTSDSEVGEILRNTMGVSYLSLEALKKLFTPSKDNRKLNKLTIAEHEVVKLGFFLNNAGATVSNGKVKSKRRVVRFMANTMSDKSTMTAITALSQELKLDSEGKLSADNLNLLYEATILPEIKRIQGKQPENVSKMEPGYFYLIPQLNFATINVGGIERNFRDFIIDGGDLTMPEVKETVNEVLQNLMDTLVGEKLAEWEKLGIGIVDSAKREIYTFLDKTYMSKIAKGSSPASKVKYTATDFIFNYLIANAESYKLFAGDPAIYAKFDSLAKYMDSIGKNGQTATQEDLDNYLYAQLENTFTNLGKRLAGEIAPGLELADSLNNKYYQVFLEDKKIDSNNVTDSVQREYFEKIMKDFKKNYSGIEGSDAQEYTTWKEHLYVIRKLGRLTDEQYNKISEKLTKGQTLTYEELGTVLQPIKPVYNGNVLDVDNNIDRKVYIKSSSFPLIPQLTAGFEIDKIRQALEDFENKKHATSDGSPMTVRASFGTANKVGAVKKGLDVFDKNGNVLDNLVIEDSQVLELPRSNFRIQQDVPFKIEKDSVNIGTQERKLLFVNLLSTEIEPGVSGESLLQEYNNAYEELFAYKQEQLMQSLGLIETVIPSENKELLFSRAESNIFEQAEALDSTLEGKSNLQKTKLKREFKLNVGEDNLDRIAYINKNFDAIVEKLLSNEEVNKFLKDDKGQSKMCK